MTNTIKYRHIFALLIIFEILFFWSIRAEAHCDSLDGPVIIDAKKALEQKDIRPVLKWIKQEHESELRGVFRKTLVVREKGSLAQNVADLHFFETLVRLHRAGEGAPYTGLKPEGKIEPIVALADKSLNQGSIDDLATKITKKIESNIKNRFSKALLAKKEKENSVPNGRDYVEAYVAYVHFLEELHGLLDGSHKH